MDAQQQSVLGSDPTLDAIVREWARAKIQKMDILNHNGAMLAYTAKADVANRMGLTDEQKLGVTPFPAATTTIVADQGNARKEAEEAAAAQEQKLLDYLQGLEKEVADLKKAAADNAAKEAQPPVTPVEPTPPPKTSGWKKAAQAGALVAAGALGMTGVYLGGSAMLGKDAPEQPAVVAPQGNSVTNTEGHVGLEVEGWLKP